jgi:hypothetical protein
VASTSYRHIDAQWRAVGRENDPHLSEVLDALSAMITEVVGQVIDDRSLLYFDKLRSFGYSELPEQLDLQPGELWVLHYPRRARSNDITTANWDGVRTEMYTTVAVAAIVGWASDGAEMLMAKSADVPELLEQAYLANGLLNKADGTPLLSLPLSLGELTFGQLNFAGNPVGWGGDINLNLQYTMRNWRYG